MTNPFNYCIIPSVLGSAEFEGYRKYLLGQEHTYSNCNNLGWAWRAPLRDLDVDVLLGTRVMSQLAHGLGMELSYLRGLKYRYWDSVLRRGEQDGIITHSDEASDVEPERKIALAYYVNEKWDIKWGGEITLHFTDGPLGQEEEVGKVVIPPIPNTLVAFEVTSQSWHTVAPVTPASGLYVHRHAVVGWLNEPGAEDRPNIAEFDYGPVKRVRVPGSNP